MSFPQITDLEGCSAPSDLLILHSHAPFLLKVCAQIILISAPTAEGTGRQFGVSLLSQEKRKDIWYKQQVQSILDHTSGVPTKTYPRRAQPSKKTQPSKAQPNHWGVLAFVRRWVIDASRIKPVESKQRRNDHTDKIDRMRIDRLERLDRWDREVVGPRKR
jgi:hypothetical protein